VIDGGPAANGPEINIIVTTGRFRYSFVDVKDGRSRIIEIDGGKIERVRISLRRRLRFSKFVVGRSPLDGHIRTKTNLELSI